jgi:hypothetical protein
MEHHGPWILSPCLGGRYAARMTFPSLMKLRKKLGSTLPVEDLRHSLSPRQGIHLMVDTSINNEEVALNCLHGAIG